MLSPDEKDLSDQLHCVTCGIHTVKLLTVQVLLRIPHLWVHQVSTNQESQSY